VSVVLQSQLTIMSSADDCISNVVKVAKDWGDNERGSPRHVRKRN
jgi:hypothetical protein